jgi:hypothetical protein
MMTKTLSRMRKTMRRCQRGDEGLCHLTINDGTSDDKGGD